MSVSSVGTLMTLVSDDPQPSSTPTTPIALSDIEQPNSKDHDEQKDKYEQGMDRRNIAHHC